MLERRIAELGLERTVFLLGHRLDIPAILARSRAACSCSSAEGLSNALMEAMAASLPIVATAVGGNPELVHPGENGFLVPYGDVDALARSVVEMLSDPAAAAEMGRRGRRRIEDELSLDKMAEGHGALYRLALARRLGFEGGRQVAAGLSGAQAIRTGRGTRPDAGRSRRRDPRRRTGPRRPSRRPDARAPRLSDLHLGLDRAA